MSMTFAPSMAKPKSDDDIGVIAGSGGVELGEYRSEHEGRKAILLMRGSEDTSEYIALVKTMGIEIVEVIEQAGKIDGRSYFGKGRLQDVADELKMRAGNHPWKDVDLILLHTNATPRQLVGVSKSVQIEVWDRVRLLLSLFQSHASSLEARTQVRIARLRSDITVLRELINQETTGERAGYGGGGVTGIQAALQNFNRELATLRKRLNKYAKAQAERRKKRTRSGAMTVGLVGYTNAGKSSLFRSLSGKEVLVQDKLFSTLETTIGRMEASPRVLLADTIGFIDNLPSQTLEAFRATLAEAFECDLLILVLDATDSEQELLRRLHTSLREIDSHSPLEDEDDPTSNILTQKMMVVLSKCDLATDERIAVSEQVVIDEGLDQPFIISSHNGIGMKQLKEEILFRLYGPKVTLKISPNPIEGGRDSRAYLSDVHNIGLVQRFEEDADGGFTVLFWCEAGALAKLIGKSTGRISLID